MKPKPKKVVIITALQLEYNSVRKHLGDSVKEYVHKDGDVYEIGRFEGRNGKPWEVLIVEAGKGNQRSAQAAVRAFGHFNPEVALFVGIAGGIKDVAIGDVVAADKIYGYESGKEYDKDKEGFNTRPSVAESSHALEQRARSVARKHEWVKYIHDFVDGDYKYNAIVAPIASGEKVIASSSAESAQMIRQNYGDAVALEMEGRGFLQAVHACRDIHAIVIRGISDLLDRKAESDANGMQKIAAVNAAAFAFATLDGLHANDSPVNVTQILRHGGDEITDTTLRFDKYRTAFNFADMLANHYAGESADRPLLLSVNLLAVASTYSWDFLTESMLSVATSYPNVSVDVRVLLVHPESLLKAGTSMKGKPWKAASRDKAQKLKDFKQDFKKRLQPGDTRFDVKLKYFKNIPHWHGLLLSTIHEGRSVAKNLFLGRTNWVNFPEVGPCLRVGENIYRYYSTELDNSKDRIDLFEGWWNYYWDNSIDSESAFSDQA